MQDKHDSDQKNPVGTVVILALIVLAIISLFTSITISGPDDPPPPTYGMPAQGW